MLLTKLCGGYIITHWIKNVCSFKGVNKSGENGMPTPPSPMKRDQDWQKAIRRFAFRKGFYILSQSKADNRFFNKKMALRAIPR